jgi:phosphopantothenoylcysteine decarboxylase/phosphopantothenate--cysteine ligase
MKKNKELKGRTVVVGITGGIAAYKTCELVRSLAKEGADVHVILTEAARHFVTPLTLQTLSKNPVHCGMFEVLDCHSREGRDPQRNPDITNNLPHISLADRADLIVIAPACANTIAKVAHGICDDLLSTTICATKARVVFAPSMNVNMWKNPITQENIAKLKKLGYSFIAPEEGELACGYKGVGRMADTEKILSVIASEAKQSPR